MKRKKDIQKESKKKDKSLEELSIQNQALQKILKAMKKESNK